MRKLFITDLATFQTAAKQGLLCNAVYYSEEHIGDDSLFPAQQKAALPVLVSTDFNHSMDEVIFRAMPNVVRAVDKAKKVKPEFKQHFKKIKLDANDDEQAAIDKIYAFSGVHLGFVD